MWWQAMRLVLIPHFMLPQPEPVPAPEPQGTGSPDERPP
jgi:hypothetical protein